MLLNFKCILSFFVIMLAIAFTAYRVNSRRAADDPKKRNYQPGAIVLAPFIFLVVAPLAIVAFILAAFLYAGFIIFFIIMLVAFRKPFLLVWWNKFATLVGEPLLRIGTYLIMLPIRLITPTPKTRPQTASV